jgi:hypothetical protein
MLHLAAEHIAAQAADTALVVFNSQPQTPTKEQPTVAITETIAKALLPAPNVGVPKLRAEWDALQAAMVAANAECAGFSGSGLSPQVQAAENEANATANRLRARARRIANDPARTPADLLLLAEVARQLYDIDEGEKAARALLEGLREMHGLVTKNKG